MEAIKNWQRDNYFKLLVETGEDALLEDYNSPRLVILVRDDILPPIHQGIQAMHAVIALTDQPKMKGEGRVILDPRCYLILLGATMEQIEKAIIKAHTRGRKQYAIYKDPGLVDPKSGFSVSTACAFEPMTNDEVRLFFGGLRRAR